MSREDFIKEKIKQNGMTIKSFAEQIDMPYSTLLSMLNGSIGGAAVDRVIEICQALGITVEELEGVRIEECAYALLSSTKKEQDLIKKYRCLDDSGRETVEVVLNTQYKRCVGGDGDNAEFSSEIC